MTAEQLAYHALALRTGGSYATIRRLRSRFPTWTACIENYHAPGAAPPEEAWAELEDRGIRLILREDADYPSLLREIPHPPHALYIKGTLPAPPRPVAAMVGTRKATTQGKVTAMAMARKLATAGCAVVSGLAFGIDAASHIGCLQGQGPTVAVLAHGLDTVHPRGNGKLAEKILACGGALVSEYPPGLEPLAYRFLERNRIVSGLSHATVVIEAPARSGVIATSRFAMEQNRSVLVVPGPAAHPNFQGSHGLIRSGATLVRDAADVLEELPITEGLFRRTFSGSDEQAAILEILRRAGRVLAIDEIIETTNLHPSDVHRNLTFLLLDGTIREKNGGYAIV